MVRLCLHCGFAVLDWACTVVRLWFDWLGFGLMVVRVCLGCICGQAVLTLWFRCIRLGLHCGQTVVRLVRLWFDCG